MPGGGLQPTVYVERDVGLKRFRFDLKGARFAPAAPPCYAFAKYEREAMLDDLGFWIAVMFPVLIGAITALVLGLYSGRQKPDA